MNEPPVVGFYPSAKTLQILIAESIHHVENSIRNRASLAERHNAFTDYCLLLLFFSTGHRPILDSFQSIDKFDLEEKWLLICDKVIAEERAWRLVALPTLAAQQITTYLNYLPKLAAWIAQEDSGSSIANEIQRLAFGDNKDMPLFFYLKPDLRSWQQVKPTDLKSRCNDFWPLPLNFSRRIVANELLERCQRTDWVQIQLGHMDGIDHPLGRTSTQSVRDTLTNIRLHIDAAVEDQGWKLIKAPLRMPGFGPIAHTVLTEEIRRVPLGDKLRSNKRKKQQQVAADLIRNITNGFTKNNPINNLTSDQFNELIMEIISQSTKEGVSSNRCLRLFYRYISRVARHSGAFYRQARIRTIELEASPFLEESVSEYKELIVIRNKFLLYLDKQGRAEIEPNRATRIAEIIIASALFSGIADQRRLRALHVALSSAIYRLEDYLFVDIPLKKAADRPVFRLFPEPISSELIIGLYKLPIGKRLPGEQSIIGAIKRVLRQAGKESSKPYDTLSKLSSTGLTFEVPGYVASVLQGKNPSVSLPLAPFTRVVTNKSLVIPAEDMDQSSTPQKQTWAPDIRYATSQPHPGEPAEFISTLNEAITTSWKIDLTGNKNPSTKRKQNLSAELRNRFRNASSWSCLSLCIVSWAAHLCRFGTINLTDLAYSTIDTYVRIVSKPLTKLVKFKDFLSLDDIAFEELYARALLFKPASQRSYLAGRLLEFHHFLVEHYGVEMPDWSALLATTGTKSEQTYADANFVTFEEYQLALKCIKRDNQLTELNKIQYSALVIFGYRFNLRFSEAYHLQYRDIQYDDALNEMYLVIRNDIFGEVKSQAGSRIIPLLENLTDMEREILRGIIAFGYSIFENDPLAPLMAATPESRTLISRDKAAPYLNTLLRQITGDNSLRFHHLRHGWATRTVNYMDATGRMHLSDNSPSFIETFITDDAWTQFVGTEPNGHPLRSISTAIGHADEFTTVASYVHCIDMVSAKIHAMLSPKITDHASAYCLQAAHATIRRRRSRQHKNGNNTLAANKRIAKKIPTPSVEVKDRTEPCVFSATPYQKQQLSLLELELLLRRYGTTVASVEKISHQLFIDKHSAENSISIAGKIERDSGYTRYGFENRIKDPLLNTSSATYTQPRFNHLENTRTSQLIGDINPKILGMNQDEQKTLIKGLNVWARTYRPASHSNTVTELTELNWLLSAYRILLPDVTYSLLAGSDVIENPDFQAIAASYSCEILEAAVPLALEKSKMRRHARAELKIHAADSSVGTVQTFHRLIFILAVALATPNNA